MSMLFVNQPVCLYCSVTKYWFLRNGVRKIALFLNRERQKVRGNEKLLLPYRRQREHVRELQQHKAFGNCRSDGSMTQETSELALYITHRPVCAPYPTPDTCPQSRAPACLTTNTSPPSILYFISLCTISSSVSPLLVYGSHPL